MKTYLGGLATVHTGHVLDVLRAMPDKSVDCIVTSPPYWGLRNYGVEGQIGLEPTFAEFLAKLVDVFEECRRVLKKSGTMWVNMGDSYHAQGGDHSKYNSNQPNVGACRPHAQGAADKGTRRPPMGIRPKNLIGQPWRLAFALQHAGWILRSDIIWHKPNPMPESVQDRPTKSHEYLFLLTKSGKYFYDADAIRQPLAESSVSRLAQNVELQIGSTRASAGAKTNGNMKAVAKNTQSGQRTKVDLNDNWDRKELARSVAAAAAGIEDRKNIDYGSANARTVWTIPTTGYPGAHFATFPEELPRRCILAGCPVGGVVLDIFAGSGTTLQVAVELGRIGVGIELNPEYVKLIEKRLSRTQPPLDLEESA